MRPRKPLDPTVRTQASTILELREREVEVTWTRVTEWWHDAHYGADADGNRGVPMSGYEDRDPENIEVRDTETGALVELDAAGQVQVDHAIEQYQKQHDPEAPEPDEGPEPEYDPTDELERRQSRHNEDW